MLKKLAIGLLALALVAPFLSMVGIGLLMNPAATWACTVPGGGLQVGEVPDELAVETRDGESFTLNKKQLTHAATIIETGSGVEGVNRDGLQIALMAALTESTLRQLSNTSVYPESADYPNDGDGSDNDSLGLFQMRPQAGWGSVPELMAPEYQARAFFGGPDGPNHPSPRGLLDIPGWQDMGKGEAAQAVEVSAFPDRYENYSPVAVTILDTLLGTTGTAGEPGRLGAAVRGHRPQLRVHVRVHAGHEERGHRVDGGHVFAVGFRLVDAVDEGAQAAVQVAGRDLRGSLGNVPAGAGAGRQRLRLLRHQRVVERAARLRQHQPADRGACRPPTGIEVLHRGHVCERASSRFRQSSGHECDPRRTEPNDVSSAA